MPTRSVKTFGLQKKRVPQADSINRDSFPAFTPSLKNQYVQTLLTNTFGNTYYASAKALVEESAHIHEQMLKADIRFVAKALVFARNQGFMRSQPIYGLARLAGVNTALFRWAFPQVILTPKDLADFTVMVDSLRGGQGGRAIKQAAGDWLVSKLTEYWAIKYGAEKSEGYSLADMVKVYHPDFSGRSSPIVSWLLDKEINLANVPQIMEFERLKGATTDDEKVSAITMGRLPHEVATSFAGSSISVWSAIIPQLPIFALLRNLVTLERHGVADANRKHIESVLGNSEAIQKSKILPFRFLEASKHITKSWLHDAVIEALELSFENVPDIPGRVAVLVDVSGSMTGMWLQVAGIFGVAVMKKNNLNGRFFTFTDEAKEFKISKRDSILSQAAKLYPQKGTNTSSPIDNYLLPEKDKVNVIVTITDGQQNQGRSYVEALEDYRRKVNPKTKSFVVDVSAYQDAIAPNTNPLNFFSFGWSDAALAWISMMSGDIQSLSDVIEQGEFPTAGVEE